MDENSSQSANTGPWHKGISAITLFVEDLDAAKEFYGRAFDLPVVYEDKNSAVFKFGPTLINLLKISQADESIAPAKAATREAGSRAVFTLEVQDVDEMCDKLTRRGIALLNGPMNRPWGIRTASFVDPAGNIWEIAR